MMKAKHILFFPIILLLAVQTAKAQRGITDKIGADEYERGPSLDAIERNAANAAKDGDDYAAMIYYRRILEADSLHQKALKGYGEAAMNMGVYEKAEWAYQLLVSNRMTGPDGMPIVQLAEAKFQQGKYAEAKELYRYLFIETPVGITPEVLEKAENGLEYCDFALELEAGADTQAQLDTLKEVSTPYSEFAPFFKGDTLFYSSYRYPFANDKRYPKRQLAKVLYALPKGDTLKSELADFNEVNQHTSNTAFNEKGDVMYYTICNFVDKTARTRCDIYMRKLAANNTWGPAVKLPPHINHPADSVTNTEPNVGRAPGEDAEVLYFVSNRPGGKGKRDIWYSRILPDGFSEPKNLDTLNTKESDVTPFYHSGTGKLFFSTNGRPTVGGYDVYCSKGNGDVWDEPKHMGLPANSPGNDVYFSVAKNGKSAVFSSNRKGANKFAADERDEYEDEQACCYDIFQTSIEKPEMIAVTFNKVTGDSLHGTVMQLVEYTPKGAPAREMKANAPKAYFPFALQPRRAYMIVATKPRFSPDTLRFDTPLAIWKDTLVKKLYLKPASPQLVVTVYDKETGEPIPGATVRLDVTAKNTPNGMIVSKGGTPLETSERINNESNRFDYPIDFEHRYRIAAAKLGYIYEPDSSETISTEGLEDAITLERKLYLVKGVTLAAHTINSANRDTLYGVTYRLVEVEGGNRTDKFVNPPGTKNYETTLHFDREYMLIASKDGFTSDTVRFTTKDRSIGHIERELRLRPLTVQAYLPIKLFFDNDEPDKRTTKTTTDRVYQPTYVDYYRRKPEFLEKFSEGLENQEKQAALDSIDYFFEKEVRAGWEKLFFFSEDLYKMMERGDYIVLTLRGFASPRAATQYNMNLTSRRVASVRNHFLKHDGGIYRPFVENGQLVIKLEPNGENLAPKDISDDIKDERRSLYDPRASRERRLEIIGVEVKRGANGI
jgi:tetratricopeptide (TPR) repeat protein